MLIRRRPAWSLPESAATSEHDYVSRRAFLREAGALAAGGAFASLGAARLVAQDGPPSGTPFRTTLPKTPSTPRYPAKRNKAFTLDRPLTDETVAATHNNFYEFTTDKARVWRLVAPLSVRPWTVRIGGMVKTPRTWDVDELIGGLELEERLYRFRCVEAWAMAVPWTGVTFRSLIDRVEPKSGAKYVRLISHSDPAIMPGLTMRYPWPYHEALTMAEARNELTLLATGIYGHELPKQHGAPLRLITPWKYGFKNIKSIVSIEFTDRKPPTFWSTAAGAEYGFYGDINPAVPHRRWSQANETLIGSRQRRPTLLYNGYAEQVAGMYEGLKDHFF